jgi:hypothetical protein
MFTSVKCLAMGWKAVVRFPSGEEIFSLRIQTGSGALSASYAVDSEVTFPWDKTVGS